MCVLTLLHSVSSLEVKWRASVVLIRAFLLILMNQTETWLGISHLWEICKSVAPKHLQEWIYSAFRFSSCESSNKAHSITTALCDTGLKALVMNNYSRGKEYGGWGGCNCRKQVCAMNYTSGKMAPYVRFMHFRLSCACLCLQSQTASC